MSLKQVAKVMNKSVRSQPPNKAAHRMRKNPRPGDLHVRRFSGKTTVTIGEQF